MFKDSELKRIKPQDIGSLIEERQEYARRHYRALPIIEAKMISNPGWHAICPKTDMPLTLPDIKEEMLGYLEEMEEEIAQLENLMKPKDEQLELKI